MEKMEAPAHGYSLSREWEEAMRQPVGLDAAMRPYPLERDFYGPLFNDSQTDEAYLEYDRIVSDDKDYEWQESNFVNGQDNSINIVVGDITRLRVAAIVNAANRSLLGGGGVDGAIHRAAGPELHKECQALNGCATGQSKMTDAYNLPCEKIIHTVGPRWFGGDHNEDELLASCYRTALSLAARLHLPCIAFPCISTGAYRFPKERAAKIALNVICEYIRKGKYIGDITLCCYLQEDAEIYRRLLEEEE